MDKIALLRRVWQVALPQQVRSALGRRLQPAILAHTHRELERSRGYVGEGMPALVGMFRGASGISQSAQLASRALDHLGIEHRRVDVGHPSNPIELENYSARAWVFFLNPPELMTALFRWGPGKIRGPRFGYWAWELPLVPKSWIEAAASMDGVLVPSSYTARAFSGSPAPVTVTPHPFFATDFGDIQRRRERRKDDPFRVVSVFDCRSSLARKNPIGIIEAFHSAFGEDQSARLVLKTHNAAEAPSLMEALRMRAGSNVEFIDAVWTRREVLNFIADADAFVSLHRAEGFGLSLAEAMILGTPVVATAWSGNLDFMSRDTSMLVPSRMISVKDTQRIYNGQSWADPDLSAAAGYLRQLRADPLLGRKLAYRAKESVLSMLGPSSWFSSLPPDLQASFEVP